MRVTVHPGQVRIIDGHEWEVLSVQFVHEGLAARRTKWAELRNVLTGQRSDAPVRWLAGRPLVVR